MEWVETTGRTIDQALDAALDELGVDEDEVEYEVLEEPRSGLFRRLGGSDARIRARVKPVSRAKPGERQRRNRQSGSRSRSAGTPGSSGSPARTAAAAGSVAVAAEPDGAPSDATAGTSSRSRRRGRRGGRGRGGAGANGAAARERTGNDAGAETGAAQGRRTEPGEGNVMEDMESDLTVEEQAAIAESFTTGLVDAFDLGASVAVTIEDETILVSIDGSTVGILVGPKGATLNAIEELVRTVVQRQTDGRGARINVDVGGYRAKRREALEEFTRQLAAKVVETGRAQALEPMSPPDRKIVHDAAATVDGVATESEGEEPRRRVVLRPT